jgi:hypothetical protein
MDNKFYCRNCKGQRKYNILFEKKIRGSEDDGFYQWIDQYMTIECSGCETISFVHIYGDNQMVTSDEEGNYEYYNDITIFPYYLENGTEIKEIHLLPDVIKKVYNETVNAFKAKCYILTAGGFRATIEALCNHLKIRKEDLSVRINLLHEKGFLTKNEAKRLHSIRFLGNDSLHEMEVPKVRQLIVVLEIINHILENLFIHDKKVEENIDVMIDEYDEFLKLLNKLIKPEAVGEVITLNEILGKSKRLFRKEDLKKFEGILINEIKEGINNLFIIVEENGVVKYRIERVPDLIFGW